MSRLPHVTKITSLQEQIEDKFPNTNQRDVLWLWALNTLKPTKTIFFKHPAVTEGTRIKLPLGGGQSHFVALAYAALGSSHGLT